MTCLCSSEKDCGHVIFYADNESKISGKIRVEKHVTVQERMDKTLKTIVVEAVDAWKKGFIISAYPCESA